MRKPKSRYHGHRFPASVIGQAARWHFRFQLSLRAIEELLFERRATVSYETIGRWCDKFGASFARRVKAARRKPGGTWRLDEMFVSLRGEPYLLWRAVDEHDAELDILLQKRRDKAAARVNNRAENSHQPTREREWRMRGFHDRTQAFLSCFGPIRQHFALKRHLLRATLYRRQLAVCFAAWRKFTNDTQTPSYAF